MLTREEFDKVDVGSVVKLPAFMPGLSDDGIEFVVAGIVTGEDNQRIAVNCNGYFKGVWLGAWSAENTGDEIQWIKVVEGAAWKKPR